MTSIAMRLPALAAAAVSALALASCGEPAASVPAASVEEGALDIAAPEITLTSSVANPARSEGNVARDQYRHPLETLSFFGLEPGMTVVEFAPGAGYYAEILSPFLSRTGGSYIATGKPMAALADAETWGTPTYVEFGGESGSLAPAGTADMVLTFRNMHNLLWSEGQIDKFMADSAAALKPGGVLGVVEHRADPRPETVVDGRTASDGYVAEATVIAAAEKAGLVLDAKSEINANPADTKDHPFGVWTLPPTLQTTAQYGGEADPSFDTSPYTAIGESDRMTLKFRKPAQ
ncbi:MAG: hypothetical protein R3C52_01015 [Hyphomonadaceae bacterium]